MTKLTKEQAGDGAFAVLSAIMKMSDEAEALGGATSVAGVASLHKLQTSLQKNGPRLASLAEAWLSRPEEAEK